MADGHCTTFYQFCALVGLVWLIVFAFFRRRYKRLLSRLNVLGAVTLVTILLLIFTARNCRTTALPVNVAVKEITEQFGQRKPLVALRTTSTQLDDVPFEFQIQPESPAIKQRQQLKAKEILGGEARDIFRVEPIPKSMMVMSSEHDSQVVPDEITDGDNIFNQVGIPVTLREYARISTHNSASNRIQFHKANSDIVVSEARNVWKQVKDSELPMSPKEAIARFGQYIPWWEKMEMIHYENIWTLGLGAEHLEMTKNSTDNFNFDIYDPDKNSPTYRHYKIKPGMHIAYRYHITAYLGRGTYGAVCSAIDMKTKKSVAIKFYATNTIKWIADKIMKEYRMMEYIGTLFSDTTFFPKTVEKFIFRNHICVVEELLGETLSEIEIPVQNITTLRRYTRDIAGALAAMHSHNIFHMDLKTRNIAFMNNKDNTSDGQLVQVFDFGHSCIPGNDEFWCSNYVQTMGYACPEVLLKLGYNSSCDVFSFGIVIMKMALGRNHFEGEEKADNLASLMEMLGLVPAKWVERSERKKLYMDAVCFKKKNGFKRMPYRKPLRSLLMDLDPDLADLITKTLVIEPTERLTFNEILKHRFLLAR